MTSYVTHEELRRVLEAAVRAETAEAVGGTPFEVALAALQPVCGYCGEVAPPGCGGEFANDAECAMRPAPREWDAMWSVRTLEGSGQALLYLGTRDGVVAADPVELRRLLAGRERVKLGVRVLEDGE